METNQIVPGETYMVTAGSVDYPVRVEDRAQSVCDWWICSDVRTGRSRMLPSGALAPATEIVIGALWVPHAMIAEDEVGA